MTDELPTLGYALLALLAREPHSGYDLSGLLRDPLGFFWEARHSQVYPQLRRLEDAGLLMAVAEPGRGPRPTRTYAITSAGTAALRRWLERPARRWGGREDLLLKVYASWVAELPVTLRLVREAEAHHAARLQLYLERASRARAAGLDRLPPSDPRFTDYAVLRRGIGHERGRLAWCRWLIGRLEGPPGGAA
ncbi:MAG TPA: PadR family transcriptional regulator [candidate division Zixibacteria bacterium]|nr:PadR family transcriptional regulator [candidate division Zixibacteria bacterium]